MVQKVSFRYGDDKVDSSFLTALCSFRGSAHPAFMRTCLSVNVERVSGD